APAARIPSLTRSASRRRWKLHGIVSVQVLATPTIGLARSSAVKPIPYRYARAAARSGPSRIVRLGSSRAPPALTGGRPRSWARAGYVARAPRAEAATGP